MDLYTKHCILRDCSKPDVWTVYTKDGVAFLGVAKLDVNLLNKNLIDIFTDIEQYRVEVIMCIINYAYRNKTCNCTTYHHLLFKLIWLKDQYERGALSNKSYKEVSFGEYEFTLPTIMCYDDLKSMWSDTFLLTRYVSDMARKIVTDSNYFGWVVYKDRQAVGVIEFTTNDLTATMYYKLSEKLSKQDVLSILYSAIGVIFEHSSINEISAVGNISLLKELGFTKTMFNNTMVLYRMNYVNIQSQLATLLGITNSLTAHITKGVN